MMTLITYLVLQASILTGGSATTTQQSSASADSSTRVIGWDDKD